MKSVANHQRIDHDRVRRAVRTGSATAAFAATALIASTAQAGGLLLYEFGTGEPGLAAAGYAARAQDASTAFTNPAGMTRLDGTQVLVGGQLMWLNTQFSVDGATSPGLGSGDGGRAFGSNGYVPGGGAFLTHRVSPDLALGFAVAGNFGSMLDYDDDWVGRYRVQVGDLVGVSVMPSIAYRVNDKLSLGAGINGMYGMFDQKVAINNAVPSLSDGRLEIDDNTWGWGGNVGVLYEPTPGTRLGLTYTSRDRPRFQRPCEVLGDRADPELTAAVAGPARCARGCRRQGAAAGDGERVHGDRRPLGPDGQRRLAGLVGVRRGRDRHRQHAEPGSASPTHCRSTTPGTSRWARSTARTISGK